MTTFAQNATNPSISASEQNLTPGSGFIPMPNRSLFINSIYGKNKKEMRQLLLDMYDELKKNEKYLDTCYETISEQAHDISRMTAKIEGFNAAIVESFLEEYDPLYGRR